MSSLEPEIPKQDERIEYIGKGLWKFQYEDKIWCFEEKVQKEYFRKGFMVAIDMIGMNIK